MESQRAHPERNNNNIGLPNPPAIANFTPQPPPPQINHLGTPAKLPLAPINHATMPASTRRGGAIFSPAVQTLAEHHHHLHNNIPPPPQLSSPPPPPPKDTTPDPDPAPRTKIAPPRPAAQPANTVRYKECLKNHAASMGGHVVDGCGEFMPGGEEGSPEFLRCAACDCHRNFHRKEVEGEPPQASTHYHYNNNNYSSHHRSAPQFHDHHQRHSSHHHAHGFSGGTAPPTMVNFGSGAAAESSSEDLNMFRSEGHGVGSGGGGSSSRKRFRTKFNQDQKDKMQEFAAKIGWRIQKQDEQEVQRFCSEVGVKRQVFKVWMHNNKQAIKKRSQTTSSD